MSAKILLVEDDEVVLSSYARSLTYGTGAIVCPARNSTEAVDLVKREGGEIGAVVCDLYLSQLAPRPPELRSYPPDEPSGYVMAQWAREEILEQTN